ncbi:MULTISPECIES: acyl-CoA synthetase [unclassified Spirillospora]|uniref:acyl-CoA synthetase n=1 Tax=unclassified Spirillospora TaxID=2642701 RepID=UPI00371089AA
MTLNLATLYEAVARVVPDRSAVTCGTVTRTYAELDRRANRLAAHLVKAGIEPGQHVGVYLLNSVEYVEVMLACFKARAVPININYRYVEAELLYLFEDAQLHALVVESAYAPGVAALADRTTHLRHVLVVDDGGGAGPVSWPEKLAVAEYEEALAACPGESAPRADLTGDDRFVLYTGGTTGMPKGVVWRHEDFFYAALLGGNPYGEPYTSVEEVVAAAEGGNALTYLISMPLMHGAASYTLFMGLFGGAHMVLLRSFDAVEILRCIERHGVQVVALVGDAQARPLAEALRDRGDGFDLSSLFVIGSGGAILSQSTQDALKERLPNLMVRNSFGASESGADGVIVTGEDGLMRLQPSPAVRVIDDRHGDVAPGSGELGRLARSGHVPLAYFNDPEKSSATFPVIDGVRWVVLGDLAEVEADGTIVVHGRGSGCINSGGEKIFPEEVEQALKAHPAVMDVLVAGVPDERFGHRVGAVVELRRGHEGLDPEELRTHCRATLAGYKVPAVIEIVEQVQRSPSGKADYRWAKRTLAPGTA